MKILTLEELAKAAKEYCAEESGDYKKELFGITDGKAVGTFVEHSFQTFLNERYDMNVGNSATGLDLPSINTDIKVTSIKQPQSSCPFKDSKQKNIWFGIQSYSFCLQKTR